MFLLGLGQFGWKPQGERRSGRQFMQNTSRGSPERVRKGIPWHESEEPNPQPSVQVQVFYFIFAFLSRLNERFNARPARQGGKEGVGLQSRPSSSNEGRGAGGWDHRNCHPDPEPDPDPRPADIHASNPLDSSG